MATYKAKFGSGRGGARPGAGRPPLGEARKAHINLTIDADVVDAIDSITPNRSAWIEAALKRAIAAHHRKQAKK